MAINGSNRKVYLVSNTTYTAIVGETANSMDLSHNLMEVSDKTDEWAEYISGAKSWSASLDVNLDNTATERQVEFLRSLVAGSQVNVFIGAMNGAEAADGIAGTAYIASIKDTNNRAAVASRSISLTGNGAPVIVYPA